MRALLVYPQFPKTYWGQEYTHGLTGKRAVLPPLGLITAASLLPADWELRLVDMNIEPLEDRAIRWADLVLISAMRIQSPSFHHVVRRAHALGKRVLAGGPYVTTDPGAAEEVDHLLLGEAEETLPKLAAELEAGCAPKLVEAPTERPDVSTSPVPRFDLLRVKHYAAVGVQFSRGCPFNCEFCDIIEIFGRRPRTKTAAQLLAELDSVHQTGYRGAVFVVDDNFIGNKKAAKQMLPKLGEWSRTRGFPFDFFTEASVNLASDDGLIRSMVDAGFSAVFLGIETPSREALRETQKLQNMNLDLGAAVEKLVGEGLEVLGGFIVGFDSDKEDIFDRQVEFISQSPISMAMVGLLTALPGTQLWRRLESEGRLHGDCDGNTMYQPNFATKLPPQTLAEGYRGLLARLYEPRAYFTRALRTLELQRHRRLPPYSRPAAFSAGCLVRSLWKQGVIGKYRWEYWRYLLQAVRIAPRHYSHAVSLAIVGEHMIRFTFEDILPRIADAASAAASEAAAPVPTTPLTLPNDTFPNTVPLAILPTVAVSEQTEAVPVSAPQQVPSTPLA